MVPRRELEGVQRLGAGPGVLLTLTLMPMHQVEELLLPSLVGLLLRLHRCHQQRS